VIRRALLAAALALTALAGSARAQIGAQDFAYDRVLSDTVAVGHMDSSAVFEMRGFTRAYLMVKLTPPSGAAEPWAIGAISVLGSMRKVPDSTSVGVVQLQPIADHSYFGSAAGDSIAWGAWTTANAVTASNGEQLVSGRRPNSKWAYPNQWIFEVGNKGQGGWAPYLYVRFRMLSAGGNVYARPVVTLIRRK